ncbi:MAG TPA: SIR2 family protein, partial [Draconibacterium sp.]|nr:SIR2 family protein [Draconibacterium sp.]
LYAGYPSGKTLKDILYHRLSKSEKRHVRKSHDLPKLAEEFVSVKQGSRNELIRLLEEEFLIKLPKSTEYHDKIANIPHFNTIITTNYDSLFEIAYKGNVQVIFSPQKVSYINHKLPQIFKVHGDLSIPESIIITNSDYNRFFQEGTENDNLWTVVKERLITKNILFLGYNIEDPNIEVIFNKITEELQSHRKECFLVAPSLPPLKRNILQAKAISYINKKAETFIDELLVNLNKNIIKDHEDGVVSTDTFSKYLLSHDVLFDLKPVNNKFRAGAFRGANDSVKSRLNFTVESTRQFYNEFNDFIIGKNVGQVVIDSKNIRSSDFKIGDIGIPYLDDSVKIILKSIPRKKLNIDIKFDNGFDFENLPIEIYGNDPFYEIHCKLKSAVLILKLELKDKGSSVNLDYQHNKVCSKINQEILELSFMENLFGGVEFRVFWDNTNKFIKQSVPYQKHFSDFANFFLGYFQNLRLVENHFKVRFSTIDISEINEKTVEVLKEIVDVIKSNKLKYTWKGIMEATLFNDSDEIINSLKNIGNENALVVANEREETKITLHGQLVNLGFKQVQVESPYVVNLETVLKNRMKDIQVASKTSKIIVSYNSEPSPINQ